jgi:hypothetical protein
MRVGVRGFSLYLRPRTKGRTGRTEGRFISSAILTFSAMLVAFFRFECMHVAKLDEVSVPEVHDGHRRRVPPTVTVAGLPGGVWQRSGAVE